MMPIPISEVLAWWLATVAVSAFVGAALGWGLHTAWWEHQARRALRDWASRQPRSVADLLRERYK